MKLTKKQALFVKEYLIDLNATQAAIRAGYSSKTAGWIGQQLLAKTHIANAIQIEIAKRSQRTEITQDRVLLEIARIAFCDPRKVFDKNNALIPIHQWPDEMAATISSIKISEIKENGKTVGETKEVKFWDKGRQLELAGKHLGMFDKVQDKNTSEEPQPVQIVFTVKDARVKPASD